MTDYYMQVRPPSTHKKECKPKLECDSAVDGRS